MMKKLLFKHLLWCSIFLLPFYSWSQYVYNGSAVDLGNGCYRLTPAQTWQSGSVWFQNKITLDSDLIVEGSINLGTITGGGADGMAFVLQPVCSGLGVLGGGIGYQGIAPSLAVEFDTWQNGEFADPAADHVALMKNGVVSHNTANNLQGPVLLPELENGADHPFIIHWNAATNNLKVWLDAALVIDYTDDVVANIFGGNDNVFWGFTAATGAAINNQTVCFTDVTFTEEGSFIATHPSCPDYDNGSIDLDPAGGIPPFTFAWSNGATSEDISGLVAGTYTVTVTDGNGCQTTYSIELTDELDTEPPVISCPADITVNVDPGECGARVYYNVTSTDNCLVNYLPGFTFLGDLGNSRYFISDGSFTWTDALAHSRANGLHMAVITSAAENDFLVNALIVNGFTGSNPWIGLSDHILEADFRWINGESYSYSNWHGGEPNNLLTAYGYENYVNYYYNGLSIQWNDLPNDLPGWTPNPYILELEATQIFLVQGIYSGEVFPTGVTPVAYQAVDASGNTMDCMFTVTVVDNEYPVAVCQDISVTLADGSATITPADVDGGSSDNCGIVSMSLSQGTFSCDEIGVVPVTLTVTDAAGNSSSCTANVTVVGEVPVCEIEAVQGAGPYTGGPETTIYLGYGPQTVTLSSTVSGGSAFTYAWSPSEGLSCSDCAAPVFTPTAEGNYEFTLTVTNEFGCSSTCTITICVLDIRVPGTNGKKVYICHVPQGNPTNPQTLSISVNAVPAHIPGHGGDHLGACDQSCDSLKVTLAEGELITSWDGALSVIVYPNPSTTQFKVAVESESTEPVTLTIFDLSGKVMQQLEGITPEQEILTGKELNAGMYIMKVQQGTQVQNIRIVKQR